MAERAGIRHNLLPPASPEGGHQQANDSSARPDRRRNIDDAGSEQGQKSKIHPTMGHDDWTAAVERHRSFHFSPLRFTQQPNVAGAWQAAGSTSDSIHLELPTLRGRSD
ncbi:hypothetical protein J3459_019410 [Metarhizium acridum]|nr:hypothetical protein J3459_019410 [Metarhizium acridum]